MKRPGWPLCSNGGLGREQSGERAAVAVKQHRPECDGDHRRTRALRRHRGVKERDIDQDWRQDGRPSRTLQVYLP